MNIGDLLRKLRLIFNYKAKDICEELNISPSYLSEIEHNKKLPPLDLLQKFSDLFEIKLSTLILMSEEYEDMRNKNKAEIAIQRKMIELVNKYSCGLEEDTEADV